MRSKEIEEKSRRLKLTQEQRDVLVGTLLGDGHLETQNQGRTHRLKIEHGIGQKDYLEWLYRVFQDWVQTPPSVRTRAVTFRGNTKVYKRIGFATLSTGSLRFYAQQFYVDGKKVVPRQIRRWLTPRALAIWYMDDGSIKSHQHKTVLLNTHSFSDQDLKRLQRALKQRHGITTTVREQVDGKQLYIVSESVEGFLHLIRPYVLPSMEYKLPKVWLTLLPKK